MDKLTILWISEDKETALNMLLMYSLKSNTNKWWKECNIISWGPSNRLVCNDKEVQAELAAVMDVGVKVYACERCVERYGIKKELESLGIEIKLMGEPLTQYLQDESYRVITI